ncbi:MAG TPA: sugar ABC transporter permease, partial [Reyranella sp.]
MIAALAVIWIGFNVMSGGLFLTARNLWNLSVQTSVVAVMATGMVLIIVSRNIDLSVGSILGFTGYLMAMLQAIWIPTTFGLGFDQPYTWIVSLAIGLVVGAAIGGFQGFIVAFGRVPSFIVTLGGLLVWRGLIFELAQGQTIAPMDKTFSLLGGGPTGAIGAVPSWIFGLAACAGVIWSLWAGRRRRRKYDFPLRPM